MPLVCKGGLMYLQLQGIPTDQDLQNYPSVHLTSSHEWDPSVLDMNILKTMENLIGQLIPTKTFNLTQILMNLATMPIDHYPFLIY